MLKSLNADFELDYKRFDLCNIADSCAPVNNSRMAEKLIPKVDSFFVYWVTTQAGCACNCSAKVVSKWAVQFHCQLVSHSAAITRPSAAGNYLRIKWVTSALGLGQASVPMGKALKGSAISP